jgi:ribonuclease PH
MTEDSSENPRRVKPDGSAWREAQRAMTERNDAARKKGAQERSSREREAAIQQRLRHQDSNTML